MTVVEVLLIAIALSVDSFAVAVTIGMIKNIKISRGITFAFLCAFCQGGLLFLGELLGDVFKSFDSYDHWIAFSLLFVIGVKMLIEARKADQKDYTFTAGNYLILLGLAVATSIDALIVGISVGLRIDTCVHKLLIALCALLVTLAFSFVGFFLGRQHKFVPLKWAMVFGGLVLIGLGVKILFEHKVFC